MAALAQLIDREALVKLLLMVALVVIGTQAMRTEM
jgi:hypothetical protein